MEMYEKAFNYTSVLLNDERFSNVKLAQDKAKGKIHITAETYKGFNVLIILCETHNTLRESFELAIKNNISFLVNDFEALLIKVDEIDQVKSIDNYEPPNCIYGKLLLSGAVGYLEPIDSNIINVMNTEGDSIARIVFGNEFVSLKPFNSRTKQIIYSEAESLIRDIEALHLNTPSNYNKNVLKDYILSSFRPFIEKGLYPQTYILSSVLGVMRCNIIFYDDCVKIGEIICKSNNRAIKIINDLIYM